MTKETDKLKIVLAKCWKGKGVTLRLAALGMGMATATMGTAILGASGGYVVLFFVVTVLCTVIVWKQLEDIYFLNAVEEKIKEENGGIRITHIKTWMCTCFSKTLAILGNYIAAVMLLPMFCGEKLKYSNNIVMDCISGGMATTIMTVWLPFLLIVLGKFITKRKPKKHWEKMESLLCRINVLAESSEPVKSSELPRLYSLKGLGMITCSLCCVAYFAIYAPLLQKFETQKDKNVVSIEETKSIDNSVSVDDKEVESTVDTTVSNEVVNSEVSGENPKEESNPNGYGFSIKKEYLDAYLEYASSGLARSDYESQEAKKGKNGGGNDKYAYFAICGMHNDCEKHGEDMPYLLLSSTNVGISCGDEVYFCLYRPEKYREGWDISVECLGNLGIVNCDTLSMSQVDEVNQLYVFAMDGDKFTFVHRVDTLYFSDNSRTYELERVRYKENYPELSLDDYGMAKAGSAEAMLESGQIAEIKWFSMDEIEEARAYYEPYVVE